MIMALKDLPAHLADNPRVRRDTYEADLTELTQDESSWGVAKVLDEWDVPDKGKAGNAVQSLRGRYGPTPSEAGFRFFSVPADDKSVRYLAVVYNPSLIMDGAWEKWWDENENKKLEAKAIAEARKQKAAVEAERVVAKIREQQALADA